MGVAAGAPQHAGGNDVSIVRKFIFSRFKNNRALTKISIYYGPPLREGPTPQQYHISKTPSLHKSRDFSTTMAETDVSIESRIQLALLDLEGQNKPNIKGYSRSHNLPYQRLLATTVANRAMSVSQQVASLMKHKNLPFEDILITLIRSIYILSALRSLLRLIRSLLIATPTLHNPRLQSAKIGYLAFSHVTLNIVYAA